MKEVNTMSSNAAPKEDSMLSTTTSPARAPLLGTDDGPSFRLGPLEYIVKEDGSGTRGNLAVAEFRGTRFRVPPHKHTEHDENICILEGELGVNLGGETWSARAGSSFTIPVGVEHSVWNETGRLVRFWNVIVPARYLEYFHEMAAAAAATPGSLPPPAEVARVMGRYGLVPVPPPPQASR
jgi:mannose-6-phosphate isomerase-like protein (cupin superfamily)